MACVYVLQNKINGKIYVGQTVRRFESRLSAHKKSDSQLGRAIRKHGIENFSHFENEVPEQLMDNLERNLIQLYKSISPCGYNLEDGGHEHKSHCEETRRKLSEANKGKTLRKGSTWSEESRQRLSKAKKGKIQTPEAIEKRAMGNRGKKRSEESRRRISESRKGQKIPIEVRQKISATLKGRPLDNERKQKLLKAITGRVCSFETRQKIANAHKRYRESKCQMNLDF